MLGHEDCLEANSRSTGPQQQNTSDPNCSHSNAEWSTSADWQTAAADNQQYWRLVWHCSSGMAELFHEDTDTSTRWTWIVLGLWRRASGARRVIASTNHCRTSECCWRVTICVADFILACSGPWRHNQYSITVVYRRSHKCMNMCCLLLTQHPMTARHDVSAWDKKAGCTYRWDISRLRTDDLVSPRTRTCLQALMVYTEW